MAKVELKQPVIDEIAENIKDAESVILVHFSGISVEMDTQLRKEMREAGITYKVYKNTMMSFAFKDTECEPLTQHLQGPNAIAISKTDATAPARIISEYTKKVPTIKMLAGIVEGTYYDDQGVEELASIPSREVLLGRLLGSIQSPIANLARVLNQIAEAKPEQEEKAQEEAPAEEAKADKEAPAEEAKADKKAPAEEAKADEEAPVEEAKTDEKAPAEKAKADEEAPAEKAKADEEAPAEEARTKKKASAKEVKAQEAAPAKEAKPQEAAPENETEKESE